MALKAGRVGVRPDQVDRYGRIKTVDIDLIKQKLSEEFPFLSGDWYRVNITNDGTGYVLHTNKTNPGIEAISGGLYPPVGYHFAAFFAGAQGLTKTGSESTTAQNVSYSFINALGRAYVSLPAVDRRMDITIWVMLEENV